MGSEFYDVVVVGAGPVGLMLSTCLARWGYKIKHIDNRDEPTRTGRADGIQPRSLDLLRDMGLKSAIMARRPARLYEVAFWESSATEGKEDRGIIRTGTAASCPGFIDARYPFTTLLHQGHIERIFLEDMGKNGVEVQRPWHITDFENNKEYPDYPIRVDIQHIKDENHQQRVHAKYLFGAEGARSFIRKQLGIKFNHKGSVAHVWGVIDGVLKTDFPDIRVSSLYTFVCGRRMGI
jgi:2-polyprenyl-6-methoxyphenol hydroxylase-like FAD-dependent oxidoreductase